MRLAATPLDSRLMRARSAAVRAPRPPLARAGRASRGIAGVGGASQRGRPSPRPGRPGTADRLHRGGRCALELAEGFSVRPRGRQGLTLVPLSLHVVDVDDPRVLVGNGRRSVRLRQHHGDELEHHRPQGDGVPVLQRLSVLEELAVDPGAIGAAGVLDEESIPLFEDTGVSPRNPGIVENDVAIAASSNCDALLLEDELAARFLAFGDRQLEAHVGQDSIDASAAWATTRRAHSGSITSASPPKESTHCVSHRSDSPETRTSTAPSGAGRASSPKRSST